MLVDGDELDDAVTAWILARISGQDTSDTGMPVMPALSTVAVDGKSLRGTFARTGGAGMHLLAACTHDTGTGARPAPGAIRAERAGLFRRGVRPRRSRRGGGDSGCVAHHPRQRPITDRPARALRVHRQTQPAPPPPPAHRPVLDGYGHSHRHRHRAPDRTSCHPGPARASQRRVSPSSTSIPHHPHPHTTTRRPVADRQVAETDLPGPSRPRRDRRVVARTLAHRKQAALGQ